MNSNTSQKIILSTVAAISLLVSASSAIATPYACDITNSAGTVSFRLNENADNVKIISSGGAITNDLGLGVKGQEMIDQCIGDLVGHFIRVPFANALRSE